MICAYCKQEEEYEEYVPDKEYPVGGFFKIDNEVFKVVIDTDLNLSCPKCDFKENCDFVYCMSDERLDNEEVYFILYDTLED